MADHMDSASDATELQEQAGQLMGKLNHELRTPLNAILGYAEMMAEGMFGALGNDTYQEFAQEMLQCGRYMQYLLDDIQIISRHTRGKLDAEIQPLDLVEIIQQAVTMVGDKRNLLELRLPDRLEMRGDATLLAQLCRHAISNMQRFGGDAVGQITLSGDGKKGALSFGNLGCGFDQAEIQQLYQLFFKDGRNQSKNGDGGSGLGMPVMAAIAERHGWKMQFTSQPAIPSQHNSTAAAENYYNTLTFSWEL